MLLLTNHSMGNPMARNFHSAVPRRGLGLFAVLSPLCSMRARAATWGLIGGADSVRFASGARHLEGPMADLHDRQRCLANGRLRKADPLRHGWLGY